MFHVPNEFRIRSGPLHSEDSDGNNGAFMFGAQSYTFLCVASDGMDWEHVSVSLKNRCPNWTEMCHVKDLFWDKEDWVVQYHPAESQYVNNHPHCLHLWRPTHVPMPCPPKIMVGI